MKRLVLVYGTLKRGRGNNRVMGDSKFIANFETKPEFTMYSNGGFPFVCKEGNTSIKAELFEVNNERDSRNINSLEGYNGIPNHPNNTFYDVTFVETPYGIAEMFISKQSKKHLPVVDNGCW